MKKVNLENCLVNVEESTETLKNVNGGCFLHVGLCSRDGVFYTNGDGILGGARYCNQRAKHEAAAKQKLASLLSSYGINGGTTYWEASALATVGDDTLLCNFKLYYVPRKGGWIKLV